MLPGTYVFRMRSLRTANSLTSRNISSAPPARTLMLYHYSVATPPSQGNAPLACAFLHPHGHCPCLILGDVPPVRTGVSSGYRNPCRRVSRIKAVHHSRRVLRRTLSCQPESSPEFWASFL